MTNYLYQMLDMLTGAYVLDDLDRVKIDESPETNIGKLFSIHGGALHMIHEQSDKVLLWDNIDNARGETLDRYGENFGVARQGAIDPFYRLLIKVKMLAQLSGGNVDTIIDAAAILLNVEPEKLDLKEIFPAKVYLYIDRDQLTDETMRLIDLIWAMIKRIVAAGIWIKLWIRIYASHEYDIIYNAGAALQPRINGLPTLIPIPLNMPNNIMVGGMITAPITTKAQTSTVNPTGHFDYVIASVIETIITTQPIH